jgi:hypothetical protein
MKTKTTSRMLGLVLAITAGVLSAQPVPQEPVRPVSPATTRPVPASPATAADLQVVSFTLTMPSATVVDRGRNRVTTPIELVVRNIGIGNAGRFAVLLTIARLDGTIIWSGAPQELSGTALDGKGNACTVDGLAAGGSITMRGTLSATVSRSRVLLPGLPVVIKAIVNPPYTKEFGAECGRISESSTANNSASQAIDLPR